MGALLGGPMSNKYGRKGSLWICSVGFAIGGFLMALSPTLAALVAGRMVCGISAGSAVVVVPLYIHDLAPLDKKGSL